MLRREFLSLISGCALGSPLKHQKHIPSTREQGAFRESQERDRLLALLRELSEQRSKLVLSLHDMRTPLSAVIGYAELMSDGSYGNTPEEFHGALEQIQCNAYRAIGTVNEAFSSMREKRQQLVS